MADLQVFLAAGIYEQTLQPLIRTVGDRVGKGGPAQTVGAPDPGQPYAITMEFCENQHGQGVSGGLIRNDDTLVHSFRVVVAFSDPNGVLLNDTWGTTPTCHPAPRRAGNRPPPVGPAEHLGHLSDHGRRARNLSHPKSRRRER